MDNKKIVDKIQRQIDADEDRDTEFSAYDDIDAMKWTPPVSLAKEDWMRVHIDSAGHDALKTGCDIFNTSKPNWQILPRSQEDGDNAENQEDWLEWQAMRMNQRTSEPFREVLEQSLKYSLIAGRLDYLPYWLPANKSDWNDEQKAASQEGDFCLTLYHPSNIHFSEGRYGLLWVACVECVLAATAAEYWTTYGNDSTPEGKKIKSVVNKLNELSAKDEEAKVVLVDYTDHKKRLVFYVEGEDDDSLSYDEANVIVDGENKLKFIPWIVSKGRDDPILAPLHRGHLWENANIYETIANSIIIGRGFFPLVDINSLTGTDDGEISFDGGMPVLKTKNGTVVRPLSPPPLDPGIREMMDRAHNKISTATGLSNLSNLSVGNNMQFATLNAFIQVSKTKLAPAKRLAELYLGKVGKMCFQWIEASGKANVGYKHTVSQGKVKGTSQVVVSPDDFDPDELFVQCEFTDNTPTDEQQRLNTFVTAKNAGAPVTWDYIIESMGWGEPKTMLQDYQKEMIQTAVLQAKSKEIVGAADLKLKQAEMEMQMQAQQQQMQAQAQGNQAQPQPGQPNPGFGMTQGQGFAPPQGGQSPYMANPNATQTQVQGQDVSGQGLA